MSRIWKLHQMMNKSYLMLCVSFFSLLEGMVLIMYEVYFRVLNGLVVLSDMMLIKVSSLVSLQHMLWNSS